MLVGQAHWAPKGNVDFLDNLEARGGLDLLVCTILLLFRWLSVVLMHLNSMCNVQVLVLGAHLERVDLLVC